MWRRQLGFTASSNSPLLTLVSFHCLLSAAEAKHLRRYVQNFDVSMSARYGKVSGIGNISKLAGHAALQRLLLDFLEVGLIQQFGLLLHRLPKKLRASFSLRNKPTEFPRPAPTAATLQRKEKRISLHSAQRQKVIKNS